MLSSNICIQVSLYLSLHGKQASHGTAPDGSDVCASDDAFINTTYSSEYGTVG
jgi:hypothetical protein